MAKLAIIHTTPVTIEPLKALAQELLPDCQIINFVDDSILPQLAANEGDLAVVEERWLHYARFAEQVGASCILSACSSVGELVDVARRQLGVPVLRIDEAMAEEAVRRGSRIGIAATLPTTLNPTMRLVQGKAKELGKQVELVPALAEEAYRRLIAGDKQGHDTLLVETLGRLAAEVDVIVLAQASMARVLERLPETQRERFLSSPRLGMQRVARVLGVVQAFGG